MSCKSITKKGKPCRSRIATDVNGYCRVHQTGDGIISDAKSFVQRRIQAVREGPSKKASDRLKAFLAENKGKKVVTIQLGRKPIVRPVDMFLNTISLGQYKKMQKKLNYDEVYHQFLLVTLDDGKTYKIEKNERVVSMPAKKSDYSGDIFDVPVTKSLTLPDMIDTASAGQEEKFYKYTGAEDNCQRFTRDMIERNGLLPDGAKEPQYQVQDAKSLVDTLPGKSLIPNAVTDLANVIDRVRHGDGARPRIPCPL